MKNTLKFIIVVALVALCSNVSAQNAKLAHISWNELIVSMSEYDTAMVQMQKFAKELESEIELLNVERNKKVEEYQKNQANWADIVRSSKEQELLSMNQRIEMFQQQAQESYQQKQNELMQPIIEKANKAVETVAKEQGITYVFTSDALLFKAVNSIDLLADVKKHMGIKK